MILYTCEDPWPLTMNHHNNIVLKQTPPPPHYSGSETEPGPHRDRLSGTSVRTSSCRSHFPNDPILPAFTPPNPPLHCFPVSAYQTPPRPDPHPSPNTAAFLTPIISRDLRSEGFFHPLTLLCTPTPRSPSLHCREALLCNETRGGVHVALGAWFLCRHQNEGR